MPGPVLTFVHPPKRLERFIGAASTSIEKKPRTLSPRGWASADPDEGDSQQACAQKAVEDLLFSTAETSSALGRISDGLDATASISNATQGAEAAGLINSLVKGVGGNEERQKGRKASSSGRSDELENHREG